MKLLKWLDKHFEESFLVVFLAIIFLVMTLQIISRYIFNASLSWPEELTRYVFVYSTFLSVSYTIRNNRIMRVEVLVSLLPRKISRAIMFFVAIVTLAFFCYTFYHSWPTLFSVMSNNQRSAALQMPIYFLYTCFPIGFGLSIIRSIQSIYFLTKS